MQYCSAVRIDILQDFAGGFNRVDACPYPHPLPPKTVLYFSSRDTRYCIYYFKDIWLFQKLEIV